MSSVTIAITQPTYLPWMGYFNLIAEADVFVFLDTVQFEKQSWQSRNRLLGADGAAQWVSVPTAAAPLATDLKDIRIASNPAGWRQKHLRTISQSLGRAPFYAEAEEIARVALERPVGGLAELNITFITAVAARLGLTTDFHRASAVPVAGRREELLLALCRHFDARRYYSNVGSAVYLDAVRDQFEAAGIDLRYQDWEHPTYSQGHLPFVPYLSVLDAIAHLGLAETSRLVRARRPIPSDRS